jgi:hypothetical protein
VTAADQQQPALRVVHHGADTRHLRQRDVHVGEATEGGESTQRAVHTHPMLDEHHPEQDGERR